jgi:hypothetical protein
LESFKNQVDLYPLVDWKAKRVPAAENQQGRIKELLYERQQFRSQPINPSKKIAAVPF